MSFKIESLEQNFPKYVPGTICPITYFGDSGFHNQALKHCTVFFQPLPCKLISVLKKPLGDSAIAGFSYFNSSPIFIQEAINTMELVYLRYTLGDMPGCVITGINIWAWLRFKQRVCCL